MTDARRGLPNTLIEQATLSGTFVASLVVTDKLSEDRIMTHVNERRINSRREAIGFLSLYQLGINGKRENGRRESDANAAVDKLNLDVVLVAIGIVIMSAMDATFTLRLLELGAIELNAVMAVLIENDARSFVAYKLGLTALSVLLLVIHNNARLRFGMTAAHLAKAFCAGYVLLITYELYLFKVIGAQ